MAGLNQPPFSGDPPPRRQHTANQQVALSMDADIQGGLFVKGYVFSAAQVRCGVCICC